MIHCVTPTGSGDKAEVSAPKRCNPAPGLHLAEPAIVGRNDDVSRKHHFDADRKDNPRNRGDSGLPTLVRQAEWIEISDLRALAATIKARWICEQAHQQLKEERA